MEGVLVGQEIDAPYWMCEASRPTGGLRLFQCPASGRPATSFPSTAGQSMSGVWQTATSLDRKCVSLAGSESRPDMKQTEGVNV